MRVMVIDDSRAMRGILRRFLEAEGFEVAEANNGVDALARLAEHVPVDLAMVDWNMPEMNGLEFLRCVRGDDRYSGMRLMMVTTETEMDLVRSALEGGADEYLMKPFSREALREKLMLLGLVG